MTEETFSHLKATFEQVARAFAAEQNGSQIKPWPGRHKERFILVEKGKRQLCVNAEPSGRSIRDIEAEQLTVATVRELGYELAVPLITTSDDKAAVNHQGIYWTAREYVQAETVFNWRFRTWGEGECQAGGLALARLHSIGDGANLSVLKKKSLKPAVDWKESCLNRLRFVFARASEFGVMPGHNLTVAAAESLAGHLQGKVEQIAEVQSMIEQWLRAHGSKYAWQAVIHGDFHPGNLLFGYRSSTESSASSAEGTALVPVVKAVIDWDFARLDDPLFDLAYARMMFSGNFRESNFSADNLFDKTLCSRFEDSYRGFLDTSMNEHYLWLIVLCSLVIGDDAGRQEEAVAADILSAYSEIVLALILIFELETLVAPCALAAEERGREDDAQLQERQQIELIVGNIMSFFLRA